MRYLKGSTGVCVVTEVGDAAQDMADNDTEFEIRLTNGSELMDYLTVVATSTTVGTWHSEASVMEELRSRH